MKHIVVTDTHLGIYNASDLWHKIAIDLFSDMKVMGEKREINSIVHLGDFFHNRKETNTKTLDTAQFIVEKILPNFKINIVIGNHDTYYKNKIFPNSLQIFKEAENVNIIYTHDYLNEDKNIILCPWNEIPNIQADPSNIFLFGHFEINGFLMNSSYRCKSGIDKRTLREFKHVYSGHFHTPSAKGNITYLGSPYGLTWHDVNSKRGYYIFDSNNGEMEFIEYKDSPKFIVVGTENINREEIKGNFVKLLFQKDYGHIKNQKIVDDISNMMPLSLQTDYSQISFMGTKDKKTEDIKIIDQVNIIKEYVEKTDFPEHIKKSTLLNFMDKLMI